LKDIPLIVVTNDQLGVLGARQYALKLLDEDNTEVLLPWTDVLQQCMPAVACCQIIAHFACAGCSGLLVGAHAGSRRNRKGLKGFVANRLVVPCSLMGMVWIATLTIS
jgi:hypothetical protein